jgi:hypothetical protein
MQKKIMLLTLSIMFVLTFAVAACCVQTFTVPALSQSTQTFTLNQGDVVEGNITVTGGLTNDINFNVTDPNGNTIVSFARVTQTPFSFQAQTTGTYSLIFDNSFSILTTRSVTLDYLVKPATLGIPLDMLPLVIGAIVAVIVVIVVVAVLFSKRKGLTT